MALYQQSEDLIRLGAYTAGTNAKLDAAVQIRERLTRFLQQRPDEAAELEETRTALAELASRLP